MKQLSEKLLSEWSKKGKAADASHLSCSTHSSLPSLVPAPIVRPSRLKLELPKFSGDLLEWREIWNIFSAHLSRETDLSEDEQISCLEKALGQCRC